MRRLAPTTPVLGVCLGHQAIVEVFGGQVSLARELVHGKSCTISHDGRGLFAGLPEESLLALNGQTYRLTYRGGKGGSVLLVPLLPA